jgi:hypothetical protein
MHGDATSFPSRAVVTSSQCPTSHLRKYISVPAKLPSWFPFFRQEDQSIASTGIYQLCALAPLHSQKKPKSHTSRFYSTCNAALSPPFLLSANRLMNGPGLVVFGHLSVHRVQYMYKTQPCEGVRTFYHVAFCVGAR